MVIRVQPFHCEVKLKYFPNLREKELREKLRLLLSDRIIKENNKILKNSIINSNVSCGEIITNNTNYKTNCSFNYNQSTNVSPTSNYSRNNIVNTTAVFSSSNQIYPSRKTYDLIGNNQIISPKSDLTISQQNPHFKLFEKARFFIIKSSNRDNINTSKLHNEWATTIANQKKLNDAFLQKDVILIFSVNKSGFFQGYAVMTSLISNKVSSLWNNDYSLKLGGTFSIQWLIECEMPFNYVKNLTNPLNNYEPVVKSRDTQEILEFAADSTDSLRTVKLPLNHWFYYRQRLWRITLTGLAEWKSSLCVFRMQETHFGGMKGRREVEVFNLGTV